MKMKFFVTVFLVALSFACFQARAQDVVTRADVSGSGLTEQRSYDQLFSIQVGAYKPKSIAFTNWNNTSFRYDDASLSSFVAQMSWGIRLFTIEGTSVFLQESLGYSKFSFKLPQNIIAAIGNQSVSMHMFGLDSRLLVAWDTFPVASLTPFAEGGYQHTFYNQTASNDLLSADGGVGNFGMGAGLRFWVNRGASISREYPGRYVALPIFLTAKLNYVVSNGSEFDPGATTVLGGLSVGL